MIDEWNGHSAFLKQRHINELCRRARIKSARIKEWVRLCSVPSCLPVVGTGLDQFIGLGLKLDEAEVKLVKRLKARKRVVGVQCMDCILVHPGAFGRELMKLVKAGLVKVQP